MIEDEPTTGPMTRHVVNFVGSRVAAAVLNLASVAVFTRLLTPEAFGHYLVAQAAAFVVYGFTMQWLCFAYFANFAQSGPEGQSAQIATMAKTLAGLVTAFLLLVSLVALTGLVPAGLLFVVAAMVVGLALYDGVVQVGRSRLLSGRVALVTLLRSVLIISLGSMAVTAFHTWASLCLAVATAHVLALLPLAREVTSHATTPWSRPRAVGMLQFGWPLIGSYGVASLGQNVDRLILAQWAGAASVGPYGAIADLVRQMLTVFGEAISFTYVPMAKQSSSEHDLARARHYMSEAALACGTVALFGAGFALVLGRPLLGQLLNPAYDEAAGWLLPWLVLAGGLGLFRSYYLGQIIYFEPTARLELEAAAAQAATTIATSLTLIPLLGLTGAVVALTAGQVVACAVLFRVARRSPIFQPPWAQLAGIALLAAVGSGLAATAGGFTRAVWPSLLLEATVLGTLLLITVVRYNILSIKDVAAVGVRRGRGLISELCAARKSSS